MSRRGRTRAALAVGILVLALPVAGEEHVHVVRAGETLWQIAQDRVGDAYRWPELYRANRDQIKDPGTLYVGQRLKMPEGTGAGTSGAERTSGPGDVSSPPKP